MTDLIAILGPTASGKTRLAAHLAYEIDAEIISADSRQVYRHMNIGTGKDYQDYEVNGKSIPFHLIDIKNPGDKYHVFDFQKDFTNAFSDLLSRGKKAILCGGTGLYIESVLKDFAYTSVPVDVHLREKLSTKSHEELKQILSSLHFKDENIFDISTHKRTIRAIEIATFLINNPDFEPRKNNFKAQYVIFGIDIAREQRRKNITERLKMRLENGLVEEVEELLKMGVSHSDLVYYGLEYKFISQYLEGIYSRKEMFERLESAIHQFAKRQMTYFRKMENAGLIINWLPYEMPLEEKIKTIYDTAFYKNHQ